MRHVDPDLLALDLKGDRNDFGRPGAALRHDREVDLPLETAQHRERIGAGRRCRTGACIAGARLALASVKACHEDDHGQRVRKTLFHGVHLYPDSGRASSLSIQHYWVIEP